MNIVIRGSWSARIVVHNVDGVKSERGSKAQKQKQAPQVKRNNPSIAYSVLNEMLSKNMNKQRVKSVKENIANYEKQSNVVEKRLGDLSVMEKSYQSGVTNLNKLRDECLASGDTEKLKEVEQLENELKALHKELVSGYQGMPIDKEWDKESAQDECEAPDVLSELEKKK